MPAWAGATIRPRWPLPTGVTMSMTRPIRLSGLVSSRSRCCGWTGVRWRELDPALGRLGVGTVDAVDPHHRVELLLALALAGLAHLADDGVAAPQGVLPDHGERQVHVVGAGEVAAGPDERVVVEHVEDAGRGHQDVVLEDRGVGLVAPTGAGAVPVAAPAAPVATAALAVLVLLSASFWSSCRSCWACRSCCASGLPVLLALLGLLVLVPLLVALTALAVLVPLLVLLTVLVLAARGAVLVGAVVGRLVVGLLVLRLALLALPAPLARLAVLALLARLAVLLALLLAARVGSRSCSRSCLRLVLASRASARWTGWPGAP